MGVKDLTFVDDSAPQCDAEYLNSVRAEVNGIITNTGQSPTTATLTQLETAVSIYAGGGDFYTDSGAADAYVLSVVGSKKAPDAYFVGMKVRFLPGNANTGASTVNVATIGAINIKLADGSTDPAANDILADSEIQLTYDGTVFRIVVSASTTLIESFFPVGSIYMNKAVATNPGTLLGFGTWVAITDKFIVSRGSTYTSTGGAATVSLSSANNGAHDHSYQALIGTAGSLDGGGSTVRTDTALTTGSSGSGTAFSIIPPYQAVYTWERTV